MFAKKDIIHSETLGVCRVHDIVRLARKNGDMETYYVLRTLDGDRSAYIPVEGHTVKLRELTEEEKNSRSSTADGDCR